MDDQLTAFHEAGHAFAAFYLGAKVKSVSIDPDWDDGPKRYGDTIVLWSKRRFTDREMAEKSAMVALAGPVAEMIFTEQPFHPATVAEWQNDWLMALQAMQHIAEPQRRLASLEQTTVELYEVFREDHHWAAIGAIADHLLAHETLDWEMLQEAVEPWV